MRKTKRKISVEPLRPFPPVLVKPWPRGQTFTDDDLEKVASVLFDHYMIDKAQLGESAWKYLAVELMMDVFPVFKPFSRGPGAPSIMGSAEATQARKELLEFVENRIADNPTLSVPGICEMLANGVHINKLPAYYAKRGRYGTGPSVRTLRAHVRIARQERILNQKVEQLSAERKQQTSDLLERRTPLHDITGRHLAKN